MTPSAKPSVKLWHAIALVSAAMVLLTGICAARIRVSLPPEQFSAESIWAVPDLPKWLLALGALAVADLILLILQGYRSFGRNAP